VLEELKQEIKRVDPNRNQRFGYNPKFGCELTIWVISVGNFIITNSFDDVEFKCTFYDTGEVDMDYAGGSLQNCRSLPTVRLPPECYPSAVAALKEIRHITFEEDYIRCMWNFFDIYNSLRKA